MPFSFSSNLSSPWQNLSTSLAKHYIHICCLAHNLLGPSISTLTNFSLLIWDVSCDTLFYDPYGPVLSVQKYWENPKTFRILLPGKKKKREKEKHGGHVIKCLLTELGHGAPTSLRSVRTPWSRAKYFPVRPSHSVNKYIFDRVVYIYLLKTGSLDNGIQDFLLA